MVVEFIENMLSMVFFGVYVCLEDGGGNVVVYCIVGFDELDYKVGVISMDLLVGKSFMGKEEGDMVKVKCFKGIVFFEIVDVFCRYGLWFR